MFIIGAENKTQKKHCKRETPRLLFLYALLEVHWTHKPNYCVSAAPTNKEVKIFPQLE
jgi:hypothetical protein